MRRLIDANALISHLSNGVKTPIQSIYDQLFVTALREAPTVDAVEVVHGRWTYTEGKYEVYMICSECGLESDFRTNYCPNCGAKMDGDGNG